MVTPSSSRSRRVLMCLLTLSAELIEVRQTETVFRVHSRSTTLTPCMLDGAGGFGARPVGPPKCKGGQKDFSSTLKPLLRRMKKAPFFELVHSGIGENWGRGSLR